MNSANAAEYIALNVTGISGVAGSAASLPIAPDMAAAAGPTELAEFVNGTFGTFSETNGAAVATVSDSQFWLNSGLNNSIISSGVSNPRLIFDPTLNRWIATEITTNSVDNSVLIAVSNGPNPDPTPGNWKAVSFVGNATAQGGTSTYSYVGFPTLGVDANGVYIATINATADGSDDDSTSMFSIPMTSLTAAGGPSLAGMTAFYGSSGNSDNVGFVPQPVVNFAATSSREAVFAIDNLNFGQVDRSDITGAASPGATLSSPQQITLADTQFPTSARQPDGSGYPWPNEGLDPLDDRIASTVYQVGNLVYMVHTIGLPTEPFASQSAIRWTVLKITGTSTSVVQEGTIEDPNFDFFTPSICANAVGDVVIGYDRSGPSAPSGDINAYFSVGIPNLSGQITFGAPQQASYSTVTNYGLEGTLVPWGQYSSVSPDPNDPDAFWSVQEVPLTSTQWTTQITEIVLPEPTSVALIAGSIALMLRPRRLRRYR